MEFVLKVLHAFNPSSDAFIFMWAILIAAIFSITIIIDRTIVLVIKSGFKSELFIKEVLTHIRKNDLAAVQRLCTKAKRMAAASLVKAGLDQVTAGTQQFRNAIDESMLKQVPQLEKRTGYLAMIGNVSTLLGLLGTVYGLIMSFAAVGRPGIDAVQKSELLAAGIATAMNSTFVGLSVAIIAIILYAVIKSKTQKIIDELDEFSLRLVNAFVEKAYQTQKYHITASEIKEGIGLHVTNNNIKVYADSVLVKEIVV
ncbi:MAG: MotA/TolQ/ExbB proton channel family protein [Chitinivibrionales bacterium]|nr:MotA/TolQ/ExbB proton channel family protein [Chitinivibrionales bacterium]